MPLTPDDGMVVHGHAQQAAGFGDAACDLYVRATGLGGAGGMVVDHPTELIIYLIFIVFSDGHLKVVPGFGSCA